MPSTPAIPSLPPPPAPIHCAGVCGMGLGPLAIYLARLGYAVTGSDDAPNPGMAAALAAAGVALAPPDKLPRGTRFLIHSNAVPPAHPLRRAAARLGIPSARRGEALAALATSRRLVAVCGSHGKTTTTAMLVTALRAAGAAPDYILGALFAGDNPPPPAAPGAVPADGPPWLVAEIDESDGTIDAFSPEITLATNLDWDHPDRYKTRARLLGTFAALFARTRLKVFLNETALADAALPAGAAPLTFGPSAAADYRGVLKRSGNGVLSIALSNRFPKTTARVAALGAFNALNATAALAVTRFITARRDAPAARPRARRDVPAPDFSALLAGFPGVLRRQTVLFNGPAAVVIEDYAHHPAEIAALLAALRAAWPRHRLAAVFQSHRFSRTKQFLDGFASALAAADSVHLLETYGAGERPLPGGGLSDLRAALRKTAPNLPVSAGAPALEKISATADAPAVIAFIGAGDIHRHARALARRLACAEWDALARRLVARREEPLAPKTTLRIGGAARLYAEPENTDDLRRLVRAAREAGVPVFMLGRGSNLVVPDNGLDALVIALRGPGWERVELLPNGDIFAAAGCRLQRLCAFAMSRGIAGFEALAGIPASLGGALRMNAGAHGVSLLERVVELHRLSPAGNVARLPRGRLGAGYRRCAALEKTGAIALGAVLRGTGADAPEAIAARMRAFAAQRRRSQPREPSAGCVFRNPPGDSAGRLIDAAGLKGLRVGGARVSPVHANFIVNTGGATAADFLALARLVREKVAQKHALTLAPEILFPGGL